MNFTPNELQNVIFKKSLIGFHQNQIYDVISRVVEDYSGYIRDNVKLKEKTDEMGEKIKYYMGIETALHNSLVVAHQTSEEIVQNARKQAENIVAEARINALQLIDQANKQITGALYEKERLQSELEAFRVRAESMLQAQIGLLKQLNPDEPSRNPLNSMSRTALAEASARITENILADVEKDKAQANEALPVKSTVKDFIKEPSKERAYKEPMLKSSLHGEKTAVSSIG